MNRLRTSRVLMGLIAAAPLGVAPAVTAAGAQAPRGPRFAVVSIKPVAPGTPVFLSQPGAPGPVYPGGAFRKRRANLWQLISFAYPQTDVPDKTLIGLPAWGDGFRDSFDVEAEAAPGTQPTQAAPSRSPADFIVVFRNKLGLALVPGNAQVQVMVIDHVQQPSSN